MEKSLKSKAIKIQGKQYVLVADRVVYFNDTFPDGQITTELLTPTDAPFIVMKATVEPTPGRKFTGYSQAKVGDGYINKTSALENAETSAVGRALAMMGIGVIDSVASVDELHKAKAATPADEPFPSHNPARKPAQKVEPTQPTDPRIEAVQKVYALCKTKFAMKDKSSAIGFIKSMCKVEFSDAASLDQANEVYAQLTNLKGA